MKPNNPLKKEKIWRVAAVLFWLAAWQGGAMLLNDSLLLVPPARVLQRFFALVREKSFYSAVLFSLALACQLLAIVALKSRTLQMRLSNLAGLLLVGLQTWMCIVYFTADPRPSLSFTTIFPIIAAILDFLAARAILRDELLVRSASRLRASKRK